MSDDFSMVKPETEVPVLDGVWLRRERERIAIGRRQVADRLGLPESQVIRVEMNKRLVPAEWFAALSVLGFPVPSNLLAADTVISVPPVREVHAPAPADGPSAADPPSVPVKRVPVAVVNTPIEIHSQTVETDLPSTQLVPEFLAEPAPVPEPVAAPEPVLEPVPEPVVESEPTTAIAVSAAPPDVPSPAVVAVAAAELVVAPPPVPPLSSIAVPVSGALLRGRWLRAQRQARDVSPLQLSQVLDIPKSSLSRFEANDMPVPSGWLPKLVALKLLDGESDLVKSPPPAPRYTGHWLRRERKGRGMTFIAIAPALHVAPSLLAFTETHDWPLPPEWLPALRTLGLLESASARSSQTARANQNAARGKAPQHAEATPQSPKRQATRAASAPAASAPTDKTPSAAVGKPLTGAWLRLHRLKKNILQRKLGKRLKTSQSHLSRYEMQDRPLKPEWLPVLQKLGFPVPTTPHQDSQTPNRAAVSVAAKPVAAMSALDLDPAPRIDGRWLSAERDRLGLSRRAVQLGLRVSWETYLRFEKPRVLLPRSWWPALRQLGMRLPTALPTPTAPPTPRTGPIDGAWLAKERRRLRLTEYDACRALQVNARMLQRTEHRADVLPKAWFPALRALGLAVDVAPAQGPSVDKTAGTPPAPAKPIVPPSAPALPTSSTSSAEPPTSTKAPTEDAADSDLAMLIVTYRLTHGRRSQQPPVETLSRILADLRESGVDRNVTHDDVEHAVKGLLRTERT